ncbi:hypothetical protein G3M54_03640 [Bacillus megaterium NBRC 15308 = ATCC 14581]|nr:hypothetical protein [Priestia megaterium NBRC 15308 = ATCC 14581]
MIFRCKERYRGNHDKVILVMVGPETKRTILIIAPILILGFLALLHIHPLVTIACVLMGIYGAVFLLLSFLVNA